MIPNIVPYKEPAHKIIKEFVHEVASMEKLSKKELWKFYQPIVNSELFSPIELTNQTELNWGFDYLYFPPITVKYSDIATLKTFNKSELKQHFDVGLQYEGLQPTSLEFCLVFRIEKQFFIMARSQGNMSKKHLIYMQPDDDEVELPYYICSMENFTPLIK